MRNSCASIVLFRELGITAVIHSDGLHDAQMRERNVLRTARPAKDISTIPTVMLAVGEGELFPTPHAHVRVGPFGGSVGVEHTARHVLSGWELEAFVLERSVGLGDVHQRISSSCATRPVLNQLQDLCLDIRIDRVGWRKSVTATACLGQADEIVHELPTRNLLYEVIASILDAGVGEIESGNLNVGILVAYAPLQTAHGLFGLDGLAADGVGDFEVEGNVFEGGGGGALDLGIEVAVGAVAKP